MRREEKPARCSTSRREFLKTSGTALAGTALLGQIAARSFAGEDNTIKLALVGCGGRGTGAAAQALSTKGPTKLWAMADFFDNRLQSQPTRPFRSSAKSRSTCPRSGSSSAWTATRRPSTRSLRAGSCCWPRRRPSGPSHVEYAVAKGCHVFMEKSFAVDAPGIRRVLSAGEEATKKNLKIAGGLRGRHDMRAGRSRSTDSRRRHRRGHHAVGLPRAPTGGLHAEIAGR